MKGDVNLFIYNIVTYACILYIIYRHISYIKLHYIKIYIIYSIVIHNTQLYAIYTIYYILYINRFTSPPPFSPSSLSFKPCPSRLKLITSFSLLLYRSYVFVVCVYMLSKLHYSALEDK